MDKKIVLSLILSLSLLLSGCGGVDDIYCQTQPSEQTSVSESVEEVEEEAEEILAEETIDVSEIPDYSNNAYCVVNDNEPFFNSNNKKNTDAFENYSGLDTLGRCGVAFANICTEIMPTEKRGNISSVHPTGWQKNKGWERCHLIGYQLSGENANERNLITGTGYLNRTGMGPFENMIADYVKETENHVLYRVTPIFEGDNLVASGVEMEAWSVEDEGEGICFNVYCYNVEPNGTIDYANGDWTLKRKIEKKKTKRDVYWTDGGSVYHRIPDCPTLARSKIIRSGSKKESGKPRGCQVCYG